MLPLVIALSTRDQKLEHMPSYAPGGRSAPDIALSRSGRLYGDRGRHGADASAGSGGFDSRCVAALPAQPRRPDGQNCQSINCQLNAHLRTVDEIRASFAKRDEGADRNAWLYSYNPLTVE